MLGVCVGMQVMFEGSSEPSESPVAGVGRVAGHGLAAAGAGGAAHGLVDGGGAASGSVLFDGIRDERFYFVHSYAAHTWELSTADGPFARGRAPGHLGRPTASASWRRSRTGPLSATQFHPEKSGDAGLALLAQLGPLPLTARARRPYGIARRGPGARPSPPRPADLCAEPRVGCRAGCPGDHLSTQLAATTTPGGPTVSETATEPSPGWSCCPPSTSSRAAPCSSCRAWPAPGASSATRSRPRCAWQEQGAEWIHLVDLDAAFGRGSNRELLAAIVGRARHPGRDERRHPRRRVARGAPWPPAAAGSTSARPRWRTPSGRARAIAEHGDRVAVGLDVRGTTLAARGWTREGGDLWETLARLDAEGCARYVVTDVTKDGMLQGPNLDAAARRLRRAPTARSSPPAGSRRSTTSSPSAAWSATGVEGAIVGSALYRGRVHAARGARRGGPPVSHDSRAHRLARVPWAGRDLSPSGFEADTGAADPALRPALAHPRRRPGPDARRRGEPVRRARRRRADRGRHVRRARRSTTQVDMAAVTLVAPDGQRALPVFTGTDALTAWDPEARPVPVTPARAGQAAVVEGCDVIVVDVAGPATRVLRPSMVWALAQQRPWEPAHTDPFVDRSVRRIRARRGRRHGLRARGGEPARRGGAGRRARPAARPRPRAGARPWPPGWGSGSPPTASCAPASTASPSGCAEGSGPPSHRNLHLRGTTVPVRSEGCGIGRESCDDFCGWRATGNLVC